MFTIHFCEDNLLLLKSKFRNPHDGEPPDISNDQYSRRKIDPLAANNDMNFATDDGAVRSIRGIGIYDERVTLKQKHGRLGLGLGPPKSEQLTLYDIPGDGRGRLFENSEMLKEKHC